MTHNGLSGLVALFWARRCHATRRMIRGARRRRPGGRRPERGKAAAGGNVMRLTRALLGRLCFKIAHSLATPGKWIAGI